MVWSQPLIMGAHGADVHSGLAPPEAVDEVLVEIDEVDGRLGVVVEVLEVVLVDLGELVSLVVTVEVFDWLADPLDWTVVLPA